jgi:Na+/melibiose symporter-like transporter
MTADNRSLTMVQLLAYGGPSLPIALMAIPLFVYLPPFYGDEMGLSLGLVGGVLLVSRLFDVVTDPLVGWASDRLPLAWGRRRPWIVVGVPLLLIGLWRLFMPPAAGVDALYLLAWSLIAAFGWTLITLPYNAWGAELSPHYHQRARIYGFAQGFTIVGTVFGVLIPGLLQSYGGGRAAALEATFWVLLLILPVMVLWLLWQVPDRVRQPRRVGWAQGWRLLAENAPFRRLLGAYLLNGLANGLPASLFLLFARDVLGADEAASGGLLIAYFGAGLLALPFWIVAARHYGKHRVWCAAMLVAADLIARTASAPLELPVGIFTAAVGTPFFVWLLKRRPHG